MPRIYVGTYAKYNSGSLEGAWLDLDEFYDKASFYEACQELHGPGDHEFMFQDWEGIPRPLIGESWVSDELWDYMQHYASEEAKDAYVSLRGSWDADNFDETYEGEFSSPADWAEEFVEDIGLLSDVPDTIKMYFDYEAFGRDTMMNGSFSEHNGHYFSN